jgi:hypothetical protein
MVIQMKEEFLAASIRKQAETLNNLIHEMETEKLVGDALAWRIRAVELQLRRIREAA